MSAVYSFNAANRLYVQSLAGFGDAYTSGDTATALSSSVMAVDLEWEKHDDHSTSQTFQVSILHSLNHVSQPCLLVNCSDAHTWSPEMCVVKELKLTSTNEGASGVLKGCGRIHREGSHDQLNVLRASVPLRWSNIYFTRYRDAIYRPQRLS